MKAPKRSKAFCQYTQSFLEAIEPRCLQHHLQYLLFLYVRHIEQGIPHDHQELVADMEVLLDFLYALENKQAKEKKK